MKALYIKETFHGKEHSPEDIERLYHTVVAVGPQSAIYVDLVVRTPLRGKPPVKFRVRMDIEAATELFHDLGRQLVVAKVAGNKKAGG